MKINQNKQAHRCFLLYCSCGELITGCGEGSVHPMDAAVTKPIRLTRTSGCINCKIDAQYIAFDKAYTPLAPVKEEVAAASNIMLGTGNAAKPVVSARFICPQCKVSINESNICTVCGRKFQ